MSSLYKDSRRQSTLRIVDVNLDRIGEGLRLLEDIARFSLEDEPITKEIKDLRHRITDINKDFSLALIGASDASSDIGQDMLAENQSLHRDIDKTVVANFRRVQESLRVLEELAKIPDVEMDSENFKRARFSLYSLEKELLTKLLRQDKKKFIHGIYVVLDTIIFDSKGILSIVPKVIKGGAKIIQLRDNKLPTTALIKLSVKIKTICKDSGVLFIVNNYPEVAFASDADGLHLGQGDIPAEVAHRLLPLNKILGVSVTNAEEAQAAERGGADYVAASAIFPTPTKEEATSIGLEGLRIIKNAVKIPVVAIGGVNISNVDDVIAAGADSVAVVSAVLSSDDPVKTTAKLSSRFE